MFHEKGQDITQISSHFRGKGLGLYHLKRCMERIRAGGGSGGAGRGGEGG